MFGHHEVACLEIYQAGADNLGLNSCRDGRRGHIVIGSDHDERGCGDRRELSVLLEDGHGGQRFTKD